MTDEGGFSLVRNPFFRAWSSAAQPDGYADRIEWAFGLSTRRCRSRRWLAGDADLTFGAWLVRPGSMTSSSGSRGRIPLEIRSPDDPFISARHPVHLPSTTLRSDER